MTAIAAMVAYLTGPTFHPWRPDRATAAQVRRCSGCKSWKAADMFSPQDHLCRLCRKTLSRENRKRGKRGKWV